MGAALSIFVILSLSVFVTRVASVALRITGLDEASARFQSLSAFTGTGFTTREAETVVNYPIRRRIISVLMIIGNMGFITVFATLVVSLVNTEGEVLAIVTQIGWLLGGMALLWILMLNKTADRLLCALIGKILESTTFLGRRSFHRLLQVGDGYSICEHEVSPKFLRDDGTLNEEVVNSLHLTALAVRKPDGNQAIAGQAPIVVSAHDTVVFFGPDAAQDALGWNA